MIGIGPKLFACIGLFSAVSMVDRTTLPIQFAIVNDKYNVTELIITYNTDHLARIDVTPITAYWQMARQFIEHKFTVDKNWPIGTWQQPASMERRIRSINWPLIGAILVYGLSGSRIQYTIQVVTVLNNLVQTAVYSIILSYLVSLL